MTDFRPPCHCEKTRDKNEREWKRWRDVLYETVPWNSLHARIARSEYIYRRWGTCNRCRVFAMRRVAVLAIFLAKLGVLTDKGMRLIGDEISRP